MNRFSTAEKEYMHSQRLGRLATVNAAGEPHVVPVTFRYNAELDVIRHWRTWYEPQQEVPRYTTQCKRGVRH